MRWKASMLLLFTATCFGQTIPLRERVLIVVNDRVRESVEVGRYYAERRQIPQGNILHLKTSADEIISMDEYKSQVEGPLRKFFDANDGAMRRRILYVVPVYGIPVKVREKVPENYALDSLIVFMYAGREGEKTPLPNPYHGATGSRPPHFAEWSDGVAAANHFKMFAVTRLDGPSAEIARGLVDKAIEGERTVNLKSGIAYFDYQGSRHKEEWQWPIDEEVREGAERARAQGVQTVLHTQYTSQCHGMIAAPTQYVWDAARKETLVNTAGGTGGMSLSMPAMQDADLSVQLENVNLGLGSGVTLTLGEGKNHVSLFYPFVPFKDWIVSDEVVLEKVVEGAVAARAVLNVSKDAEKVINSAGELRLSVRGGRIAAYRNGVELIAAEDKSGKPLAFTSAGVSASCGLFGVRGLKVQDASGKPVWSDEFGSDSTVRYQWKVSPMGGPNAQWVWGWYSFTADAYRFVPGAVGAQLTSSTADRMRTPYDADPKRFHFASDRWRGSWVPRMLEQGVTATWGAVAEPYATYYARGPNVFDHIWAGYNFGDSFYIAENAARWVMVAVGDPLYAPLAFAKR